MSIKKKKLMKRIDRECQFCGEDDYDLLDLHRIIPGHKGGKYTRHNTVTCCALCHRKIHAGKITIFGKLSSTKGTVLHYINEAGEEQFQ